ncbi:MAG: hypothetical protein RID07_10060, partial [Lacipirellulaceae bacterium]
LALEDGDSRRHPRWGLEVAALSRSPRREFNLADDPGEQNDLATEKRDLVKELFRKQFSWESELQRPLFMLTPAAEAWSARRMDEFRSPPKADY